jgi:hypothetical protein
MPSVIQQIEIDPPQNHVSVCNNATWAVGEIALQHAADGKWASVNSRISSQADRAICSFSARTVCCLDCGETGSDSVQPKESKEFERECSGDYRSNRSGLPRTDCASS